MKKLIFILALYSAISTPLAINEIDDMLAAHYTRALHMSNVEVSGMTMTQVADALPAHLNVPLPVRKGGE